MKKFTILLLMAALATTTFAAEKVYGQMYRKAKVTTTATVQAVKPITAKAVCTGKKADIPEGYAQVTLTAGDIWQDGSGYQMLLDADATAYGTIIPETGPLTSGGDASAATYAEFEYKIPENADGSCATANMVCDNSVTITIPAGVYDWVITNPTPGDRVWIAAGYGTAGGRQDNYEFLDGVGYEFVVSLGSNGYDQTDVIIDDPTAPVMPTDLTATPAATSAEIGWTAGANNETWNLRYRPYVDPALVSMLWDLPYDGYEDQIADWSVYDADGDGNGWGLAYADDAQTDLCFYSASYENYEALTPDNWLITPEVGLGGTLKFDTWNYSSYYLDKIMVYVCTNPDFESIDEFVAISDFIEPGTTAESIEISLADYEGTGYIAFRHYDCNDEYRIYIDNVEVIPANPVEIPEWIDPENRDMSNPYNLTGLTPETEYEVQVQGVAADGRTSDWTNSVRFTTLAEDETPALYMVGTFNGWSQVDDMVEFEYVDGQYTATVDLEEGDEFKLITPDEEDPTGWQWFGGVDDNQVGYFLINNDLLGVGISLVDGANFKIAEADSYVITVTGERGIDTPLVMTVAKANPTAITDITAGSKDNTWFNIQGMKIQGVPTVPGIYINAGKKVIIK